MMTLQNVRPRNLRSRNIRPRAQELGGEMYHWLRALVPTVTWSTRPPSRAPRVLGALALIGIGALAALYCAPMNGQELRATTRKRATKLKNRARELASRAREYQREHAHPT